MNVLSQELELQAKAHGLPLSDSSSWEVPDSEKSFGEDSRSDSNDCKEFSKVSWKLLRIATLFANEVYLTSANDLWSKQRYI